MNKSKLANYILLIGTLAASVVVCSWILEKIQPKGQSSSSAAKLIKNHSSYKNYSAEEIDLSLPLYTEKQGQACITAIREPSGMHYASYFGWNTQVLDKPCALQHMAQKGKRVIYFGGSAMENFEAPNYLTKIDTYISKNIPGLISLNLAESGARSTNHMMRIMKEAVDLPTDYWIFFDGYNEFNSIKYGGKYDEDFYWTASIDDRIHRPFRSLIDRFISKSRLTEKLFYETGILQSPRKQPAHIAKEEIIKAADYYVQNVNKISILCNAKNIKCLFFLQPYANENDYVLNDGYTYIIQQLGSKVIDLRPVLAGNKDAFVDAVHLNKEGGELVGKAIAQNIEN